MQTLAFFHASHSSLNVVAAVVARKKCTNMTSDIVFISFFLVLMLRRETDVYLYTCCLPPVPTAVWNTAMLLGYFFYTHPGLNVCVGCFF